MAMDVPAPTVNVRKIYPLLGILAVLLGSSMATFLGRLLSVGMPDLRGPLGLDADSASWLGTSYNMGQMFLGPFSVYLGGIFGERRVLLSAAGVLTIVCLFMPFSGHTSILLGLLAVAGLAAGTFFPLTLAVVIRGLPLKYINFGIAAYVFDTIATTHIAHSYEGWVIKSLSWEWLFWTFAVAAPVMMALILFGIPKKPVPQPKPGEPMPSWTGFLFASAGGALIYAALDQGLRLDWWRSGTFVGLVVAGIVLLTAAVIRHFTNPNPLIDIPFLLKGNTPMLGATVMFFRFVLLASVVLVPAYLSNIQNYRPEQTGAILLWLAVPQFLAGLLAVYLLGKMDERVILALGFCLITVGCLVDSQISSAWSGNNFVLGQLFLSLGLGLAYSGMAGCIILSGLNEGGTKSAASLLTFSGFFQTVRLLGGEVGSTFIQFFIHHRQVYHFDRLASGIHGGSRAVTDRAGALSGALASKSQSVDSATGRTAYAFVASVSRQAFTLSIGDCFTLLGYAGIACLFMVAFFKPMKIGLKEIIRGDIGKNIP